ncbi:MAG: M48 family metalloprotease [Thiogranum sp.]
MRKGIVLHLRVIFVVAGMALAGCQGTGGTGGFSMGSGAGNRSDSVQGRFIDSVAAERRGSGEQAGAAEQQAAWNKDVAYIRYGNKTVARLPGLQAYANTVLARLAGSWPGSPVAATVYITPQKDFEAYTLKNGAIFVSLGTLQALDNEDELAALLGHEYAHVLLKHHSKDAFEILTRYGLRYANIYLQATANSSKEQQKRMSTVQIANWVSDKALFPNWNKGQENDADILATDLIVKAGYNADAMIAMLKKVEATTLEKKTFVGQNPVKVTKTAKDANKLSIDLDVLAANAVGSLEQQLDREYESAKVRQKRVRDYLKREYRKRPRPEYGTRVYAARFQKPATRARVSQYSSAHDAERALLDKQGLNKAVPLGARALGGSLGEDPYTRMLMYYIRNAQKLPDKARVNLDKAYASGGAPMYTYELLVDRYMQRKQFQQAAVLLEQMDAEFDRPAELLPDMIKVQKQLGRMTSIYLLRCLASGDTELIKQCNLASKS